MRENVVRVNGVDVQTCIEEFTSCNIIECEVGTTGLCGGDTGNGGRTYFRITNFASTDMSCKVVEGIYGRADQIEIMFGGDTELDTFIAALEFAVERLNDQRDRL